VTLVSVGEQAREEADAAPRERAARGRAPRDGVMPGRVLPVRHLRNAPTAHVEDGRGHPRCDRQREAQPRISDDRIRTRERGGDLPRQADSQILPWLLME